MCNSCGCGVGETRINGQVPNEADDHPHAHHHSHEHGSSQSENEHSHSHSHAPAENSALDFGAGPAHAHAPGMTQSRMVQIETDILAKNAEYAEQNRRHFADHNILTLNLVSSPGSGKTSLLTETLNRLTNDSHLAVIEGDQETAHDADRIRKTGVKAVQINTGKGCHLDAHMVGHALDEIGLKEQGLLFIENVGNLVCPAGFDLGEAHKVVILSVTEGEDKPIKYPDMFYAADLMLLNKVDLLPYVQFDVEKCMAYARQVNPSIDIISCSATTGEGMAQWLNWLETKRNQLLDAAIEPMKQRLQSLEALRQKPLLKSELLENSHG